MMSTISPLNSPLIRTSPHNPNRIVDWRWERARHMHEKKREPNDYDDPYVVGAKEFYTLHSECKTEDDYARLEYRYHDIFWARQLRLSEGNTTRWIIEAMLLGRAPLELIANLCNTTVALVAWYEKLFFDVIDHLSNEMYIIVQAMGPSVHHGLTEREYDLFWKMIGYGFGHLVLRDYISPIINHYVTDIDQIDAAYEKDHKKAMRRKFTIASHTIPVYNNQAIIFEAWHRAKEIETMAGGVGGGDLIITQNIQASIGALPFTVGRDLPAELARLSLYHEKGIELRPEEQLILAAGSQPDLSIYRFPVPQLPAASGEEQKTG